MASPRLETGMRAFFTDMLELDTFDTVSKDSTALSQMGRGDRRLRPRKRRCARTIDLALHDNGDMRDLMTTRKTFINRNLAAIYQRALHLRRRMDAL